MTDSPLSDVVSQQYERWQYPAPINDLEPWNKGFWEWLDPWHAHRLLWPNRVYRPNMDILIAGCGTNQAAVFAYNNPGAQVVGVDVSGPSLDHQRYLKNKHGLENLELIHLPIEELPSLGRKFDLIVSTGVLHHMADPNIGMKALADCVQPDGVIGIMLYAKYGRIGVEIMQSVYRDIDLHQDDPSLRMVKESLGEISRLHPVSSYLGIADDVDHDAGLVDTFLHGRDRSYTVDDCLDLVTSAGLVFQDWFLRASYYPPRLSVPKSEFLDTVEEQPQEKMWSIMERLNTLNGCHMFLACHPDRPVDSYRIDFDADAAADYVPSLRWRCELNGTKLSRWGWAFDLDPIPLALAQQIDGKQTINEIAQRVAQSGLLPPDELADINITTRTFIKRLWEGDFVAVTLPPAESS